MLVKPIIKSQFITITQTSKYPNTLELQFIYQQEFIDILKTKISIGQHRKFQFKDKDRDNLFRKELERNIVYYNINRRYWQRIHQYLEQHFHNVYIIKKGKTYTLKNNKLIIPIVNTKDENIYIKDYEKKKYKIYRDR
ncbi:MAG: hypothetical protein WC934_11650 [Acidithiobacillus sp.]|jgi:hypothetical protein|uniref:hypothetical protein n=1 Tax=Acidithiobacillus sp. TaxID=1872118 RepID=UPI00355D0F10